MGEHSIPTELGLKAGEWVEVRSKAEILATLDKNGRLDELPFMPPMLQYCGQKIQVHKRVHKLCDTAYSTGGRQMSNAVILGSIRCDGQAYGGCEMKCTIIWKEAWLKRVSPGPFVKSFESTNVHTDTRHVGCSEADLIAGTRRSGKENGTAEPVYICQATQLPHATQPLSKWVIKQYVDDYTSGNVRLSEILSALLAMVYHQIETAGLGFGSAMRLAYDVFQRLRGGTPYPFRMGRLQKSSRTPSVNLNLQVGDLVRVKDYSEILKTVDRELKNRGMNFHAEMTPYCGKTFTISQRHRKIMNEKTGQLMVLKNECLVLEGVDCIGRYTNPVYCPRACYPYWREIWLERVEENQHNANLIRS